MSEHRKILTEIAPHAMPGKIFKNVYIKITNAASESEAVLILLRIFVCLQMSGKIENIEYKMLFQRESILSTFSYFSI